MKKSVIAVLVILLVAAGLVLPAGYFGQVAEQTLESRLANMPYGLQMEVVEYRRGWFSSTARLEWQPPENLTIPPIAGQGPFGGVSATDFSTVLMAFDSGPIAIDLEIAHGPVFFAVGPGVGLFNARGRIDLDGEDMEAAAELDESADNFIDVHVSSFSGGTVSNRFEFQTLAGYYGPVFVTLAGGQIAGEWTGPNAFQLQHAALEKVDVHTGMADAAIRVSMTDMESRTEYPQGLAGGAILAPSESNTSIAEVHVEGAGGNTLMRMTGMSSLGSSSVGEDGRYRIDGRMEIESLEVMEREFGAVELNQAAGGFSEAAVLKFVDALGAGVFDAPPDDPQSLEEPPPEQSAPPPGGMLAALPSLTPEMKEAIRAIVADGPYADISTVVMYQGEHALKLDSHQAFYPDRVPAGADVATLPAFVSSFEYTLDIEVPKVAAEDLFGPDLLQGELARMLLQDNDTVYSLGVALRNGNIELNGLPLPLSLPTAAASPFEESPSFPLEEDEPNPFNQAPPPPPD